MKIKNLIKSSLIAVSCLSLASSDAFAQQPTFGALPATPANQGLTPEGDGTGALIRPGQDLGLRAPFDEPDDLDEVQGQSVVLNAKFAGWQSPSGATGEDKRISDEELRGNWVMVNPNGRFRGTVVPAAGAGVENMNVFLMNMGRLVKQTNLGIDGRFEFNNVRQGAYSLIGWGDRGFFAFGINILAHNSETQGSVQNSVRVTAFQNATTINTDWIQYYASQINYRVFGRYEDGEGREDPTSLLGFEGLFNHGPASTPATSISSHPVKRTVDGRLVGRVHQLNSLNGRPVDVRTTKVMLFQEDSVVASTTTDNYGVFEFLQVPDGSYGVVAAGADGVGLIGIEVIGNEASEVLVNANLIDFTMISSETIGWLNHYANEVAYRRVLLAPRPQRPVKQDQAYGGMCAQCGNQQGGCSNCQAQYMKSACRDRGISFQQWQQMGCQSEVSKLGDGKIIADITQQIRQNTKKVSNAFDRAFYPSEFEGNNQYNNGYNQPNGGGAQPYNGIAPNQAVPYNGLNQPFPGN
ncbi:MAG: hypothetical protein ACI87E_003798 [Mariniblastus sp.]|jgi:hypothetical protein